MRGHPGRSEAEDNACSHRYQEGEPEHRQGRAGRDGNVAGIGERQRDNRVGAGVGNGLSAEEVIWILNDTEANAFLFREDLIDLVDKIK